MSEDKISNLCQNLSFECCSDGIKDNSPKRRFRRVDTPIWIIFAFMLTQTLMIRNIEWFGTGLDPIFSDY